MSVSAQIIEVLDDLCRKFGLAIDWSQENILPYLQELAGKYISWEIATSWLWIALAILLVVSAVALFILSVVAVKKRWDHDGVFPAITMSMVGAFLIIIALCIVMAQIGDILTCQYFPEKQIFEYVKGLMNNG